VGTLREIWKYDRLEVGIKVVPRASSLGREAGHMLANENRTSIPSPTPGEGNPHQ